MKKLLLICVFAVIGMSCDPEDLPPELKDLVSRNSQAWKVERLTVNSGDLNTTAFEEVRYTFTVSESGNTYTAVIAANSVLTTDGFKPNYNSPANEGSWEIGVGRTLIFDPDDSGISSEVRIVGEPQEDRIVLEWFVPETFDKLAPLCQMVLVPE